MGCGYASDLALLPTYLVFILACNKLINVYQCLLRQNGENVGETFLILLAIYGWIELWLWRLNYRFQEKKANNWRTSNLKLEYFSVCRFFLFFLTYVIRVRYQKMLFNGVSLKVHLLDFFNFIINLSLYKKIL